MKISEEIEGECVHVMNAMHDLQGRLSILPKEEACEFRGMIEDIRNRADSTLFTMDEYRRAIKRAKSIEKQRSEEIKKLREVGGL